MVALVHLRSLYGDSLCHCMLSPQDTVSDRSEKVTCPICLEKNKRGAVNLLRHIFGDSPPRVH